MSTSPTASDFLQRWVARGKTSYDGRVDRLRRAGWQVGQCAVAAGVAWWVAHDLLGHAHPFFAPVAAVVGLGTSYGQRLRRVGEVTVGVAVGVLIGDLFTRFVGTGPWQITLLVALAMTTALLLDAGVLLVTQAAVQSIIVATLATSDSAAFTRWLDALIGGGVAIVAASVVPAAVMRQPHQRAARVAEKVAELLDAAADSMADGDFDHALTALQDARSTDRLTHELRVASNEGLSLVRSSPFARRHRTHVRALAEITDPLEYALRNTRVLVRRVAVAAYRQEAVPPEYAEAAHELASVSRTVAVALAEQQPLEDTRDGLLRFAQLSAGLPRTTELSGEVVLAQLRSITADLLVVAGLDPIAATEAIPPLA